MSRDCTGSGIVLRMGALHIGQVTLPVGLHRRCCCSCFWMHSKHTSMCMHGRTCKQHELKTTDCRSTACPELSSCHMQSFR